MGRYLVGRSAETFELGRQQFRQLLTWLLFVLGERLVLDSGLCFQLVILVECALVVVTD